VFLTKLLTLAICHRRLPVACVRGVVDDLNRELGVFTFASVPGYAIINSHEERSRIVEEFFSTQYGLKFLDAQSGFEGQCYLLKKTSLLLPFLDRKNLTK
jgi:hypothetical protein